MANPNARSRGDAMPNQLGEQVDATRSVRTICLNFKLPENGPEAIGFSAVSDVAPSANRRLFAVTFSDEVEFVGHNIAATVIRAGWQDTVKENPIILAMMYCILTYQLWGVDGKLDRDSAAFLTYYTAANYAATAKLILEQMTDAMSLESKGLLLCVAVKLSYWQSNHHVGQGKLSGIVKKVLASIRASDTDNQTGSELVSAIWSLSHAIGTKETLQFFSRCSANPAVAQTWSSALKCRLTREMLLRYEGPPAGIHAAFNIHAALTRLASSPYAGICPSNVALEYARFQELHKEYECHRDYYHEGANYFLGPGMKLDFANPFTEESAEWASAFIKITAPKHSLAFASAGFVEHEGTNAALLIRQLMRALVVQKTPQSVLDKMAFSQNAINPFKGMVTNAFKFLEETETSVQNPAADPAAGSA
eukprot:GHVR01066085.1.p1 GENE.GHVR01066085.1~~GHVR01066085.1.p1  ORF type:complete len:422 (+),score=49.50 GHVR01066085.1:226-1491(+)